MGLRPLDFEAEEGMSLDICGFYEGEYAELLKAYPSPSRATGALEYSNIYTYRYYMRYE